MHDSRSPETDAAAQDEPDAPLNRAERRARRKAGKQPPITAKDRITGHQNRDAGPRMWTNRRGGG